MPAPVSDALATLLSRNAAYIPGGVSSINRVIDPPISFVKGEGAYLWDIDGKRYVDYLAVLEQVLTDAATAMSADSVRKGNSGPAIA